VFPYENSALAPFEAAVRILNPVVAVKVRSAAVHAALATVYVLHLLFAFRSKVDVRPFSTDDATAINVDDNTRIQILDSMVLLPRAEKEQCGAFVVSASTCRDDGSSD